MHWCVAEREDAQSRPRPDQPSPDQKGSGHEQLQDQARDDLAGTGSGGRRAGAAARLTGQCRRKHAGQAERVDRGGRWADGTTAVLQGTINPHTLTTTYYFQYGPTTAYGQQTATATLTANPESIDPEKVSLTATGFQSGYHYLLVASNSDGQDEGHDRRYTPKTKTTAKAKKTELALAKTFAPTALGGTFVLDGTLTGPGNANRAIVLQATPYPYSAPLRERRRPDPHGPNRRVLLPRGEHVEQARSSASSRSPASAHRRS